MEQNEFRDFIERMPDEWQLDEDDEKQVEVDIADFTTINKLLKDKLNVITQDSSASKE